MSSVYCRAMLVASVLLMPIASHASSTFQGLVGPALSVDNLPYQSVSTQNKASLIIMGQYQDWFFEGNRVGYLLNRTQWGALSLVGQIRSHQYRPATDAFSKRDSAFEMGVQLAKPITDNWIGQVTALSDVSSTHQGAELEFAAYRRGSIGEGRWLSLFALQYQTAELNDYYVGTADYQASDNVNVEWELIVAYPLTMQIEAFAIYRHYWHSDEFSDSPIISHDQTTRLVVGLGWRF